MERATFLTVTLSILFQILLWRRTLRSRVVNPTKLLNLIQLQAKKKEGFRNLFAYLFFLALFLSVVFIQTDVASVFRLEMDLRNDIMEVEFTSRGRSGLKMQDIGM